MMLYLSKHDFTHVHILCLCMSFFLVLKFALFNTENRKRRPLESDQYLQCSECGGTCSKLLPFC